MCVWAKSISSNELAFCVIGVCVCVCVCVCVRKRVCARVCVGGGQGTTQPQLLGTKALLLKDHVTVCDSVCESVCVSRPRHVIWAQGRVWEVLSRSERFLPLRQHAGRQAEEMVGPMDGWMDVRQRRCGRESEKQFCSFLLRCLPRKHHTFLHTLSPCGLEMHDSAVTWTFLCRGKFVHFSFSLVLICSVGRCCEKRGLSWWLCCILLSLETVIDSPWISLLIKISKWTEHIDT